MKLKSLKISNWKQFHAIDIEFHDRLTVLTGSNASGKTTLLNLLGRHFGWEMPELLTPIKEPESGKIRFVSPISTPIHENLGDGIIGEIIYSDDSKARIGVGKPVERSAKYPLDLLNKVALRGMYIPSDRPEFLYVPIDQVPIRGIGQKQAFEEVQLSHMKRARDGSTGFPHLHIRRTLINWKTSGYLSEIPNPEYKDMYDGFQNILRKILSSK